MNYLKTSIQSMVGSRGDEDPSSGAAIIEKLVDRLQSSTVFDDRRDALRALRSLSKRYRLDVGGQAVPILLEILKNDSSSADITSAILETLNLIVSGDSEEDSEFSEAENQDLGERFSESMIKDKKNVSLFLSLVENSDFNIRLPSVRLLTGLLRFRCKDLQEILLSTPGSIPTLTDLLQEPREVIRNDAVLLLFELIRGNSNIQKTVAFQNVLDRLLDIILQESDCIVAEDCLYVVLSLLKNNASNQHLFRENSLIQKLVPILSLLVKGYLPDGPDGDRCDITWTPQRVSNTHLLCQVVRSLVSPSNQINVTTGCQKVVSLSGLFRDLCDVILSGGVPADVLTEAVNTVADVLRGSQPNQDFFESLEVTSEPSQPALVILLLSMVSEQQPFQLRCAILYCVQCYLYKNGRGKQNFIETLLPSKTNNKAVSTGHVLCTGLVTADPLNVWFSCSIFLHCLADCPRADKERLLNVQMAFNLGQPPVSLIQQAAQKLLHGQEFLSRVGVLMFLTAWLDQCPKAVAQLLRQADLVPYLTAQAGASEGDDLEALVQNLCALLFAVCIHFNDDSVENFSKKSLKQVLEKRIGVEIMLEKLDSLSKNEHYARAAQKPCLKAKSPQEIVFDHEFTKLYRRLEQQIADPLRKSASRTATAVSPTRRPSNFASNADLSSTVFDNDGLDVSATDTDPRTTAEHHQLIVDQYKEIIKIQDAELAVLRKKAGGAQNREAGLAQNGPGADVEALKNLLEEKCRVIDDDKLQVETLRAANDSSIAQLDHLRFEADQLRNQLHEKSGEAEYYQQQVQNFQNQLCVEYTSRDPSGLIAHLEYQLRDLDNQLSYGFQAYEQQATRLVEAEQGVAQLREQCQRSDAEIAAVHADIAALRIEIDWLKNDNERLRAIEAQAIEQQRLTVGDEQAVKIQEMHAHEDHLSGEIERLRADFQTANQEHKKLVAQLRQQLNDSARDKSDLTAGLEVVRKEHEDLLLLLADQDVKLKNYKRLLRSHGDANLSPDEDEEDAVTKADFALRMDGHREITSLGSNGFL